MKKLFLIPWMLLTTLAVTTACGEPHPSSNEPEQTRSEDDGNDEEGGNVNGADGRYLVLYCSRKGNTERMARNIQSTLDCEMAEVEPAVPYDTDYNAMLDRAQTELEAIAQGDFPAITTSVESFDNYDIIFVGYPIWFGHMASPMQAFLHDYAACWPESGSLSLPAAGAAASEPPNGMLPRWFPKPCSKSRCYSPPARWAAWRPVFRLGWRSSEQAGRSIKKHAT